MRKLFGPVLSAALLAPPGISAKESFPVSAEIQDQCEDEAQREVIREVSRTLDETGLPEKILQRKLTQARKDCLERRTEEAIRIHAFTIRMMIAEATEKLAAVIGIHDPAFSFHPGIEAEKNELAKYGLK